MTLTWSPTLASSFKFDIYPLSPEPYHQAAFRRRKLEEYSFGGSTPVQFYVSTPEDAILAKLLWRRASRHVLERQWSDVLDVVRVQGEKLDGGYLREWAARLGLGDLLAEAFRQGAST